MRRYSPVWNPDMILYICGEVGFCNSAADIVYVPLVSIVTGVAQLRKVRDHASMCGGYNWVPSKPQLFAMRLKLPMPLPIPFVSYKSGRPRK
jgi:hypothetical protein